MAHQEGPLRGPVPGPLLIREKVSRIAYEAQLAVTAALSEHGTEQRARELLRNVASAYRGYDNSAGASFKGTRVQPSGVRVLFPSARGASGGVHVGDTEGSRPRKIHFQDDTLRRHHLYVAKTRMGKSTLMHHIVTHKMQEKAAGRDDDAIVVIDPHADLVYSLLEHVPEEIVDRVRLIDLADEERAPGINLLDAKVFSDRDRTADSVVRVCRRLWEQWGPCMQPILEHTVKSLHEYNVHPDTGEDDQCHPGWAEAACGAGVSQEGARPLRAGLVGPGLRELDPHHPGRGHLSGADPPGLYASSKRVRTILGLGQPRSTLDLREVIAQGGCCWRPRPRPRQVGRSRPWWGRSCSTWWTR